MDKEKDKDINIIDEPVVDPKQLDFKFKTPDQFLDSITTYVDLEEDL
jgi:hypothetical protein